MKIKNIKKTSCLLTSLVLSTNIITKAQQLPDPDGLPADMTKPVKVFIIMGQSNTLEFGNVAGITTDGTLEHATKTENLYPFMIDNAGNWTTRQDVRNVSAMERRGSMNVYRNDWLTVSGNKIGIEIGIGHQLGNALNEPVMILKSSIGNRALGWDLLPPGSRQYEFDIPDSSGNNTTYVFPGYKGSPEKWVKGTEPVPIGWYAGLQYDADTRNAKTILSELDKYYPGATNYEVAGFLWWQGDRDSRSPAHTAMYEKNLVQLIKSLRTDFNAPNAAFVTASLGQSLENDSTSNHGKILQAMKSAASDKYQQELGDNIGFVYTNPLSKGGTSGGHYNGNAQTYMNVGLAMGKEMIKQLEGDTADPNSAIEIWRKETFTPNEAAISGNAADPDKDGIKNIIEYAIGTDPKVKNTTDAIQLEKTGNTITLTYNKNNNATDIDLSVEYSFGLESSSWNLLSTNPVITPTPGNVDQMKATITVPSSEKTRFYRLKASMK